MIKLPSHFFVQLGQVVQKSEMEALSSGAAWVVVKRSAVLYHLFLKVVVPHFRLGSTRVKVPVLKQIFILFLLGLSWWVSEKKEERAVEKADDPTSCQHGTKPNVFTNDPLSAGPTAKPTQKATSP